MTKSESVTWDEQKNRGVTTACSERERDDSDAPMTRALATV
jgi:hypothetical protein